MHRASATAVVPAVLCASAVLVFALVAGPAAAQQTGPEPVENCTTITESGSYELASPNETAAADVATGTATVNGTDTENVTDVENATDGATDSSPAGTPTTTTSRPATTTAGGNDSGAALDPADAPACVVIAADDVVLDGNGTALDGDERAWNVSEGANASEGAPNATGNVSGAVGIAVRPGTDADSVSNVTVRDVTARNWYLGVYVENANGVTLADVTLTDNVVPGFRFVDSTDLDIRNVNQTDGEEG